MLQKNTFLLVFHEKKSVVISSISLSVFPMSEGGGWGMGVFGWDVGVLMSFTGFNVEGDPQGGGGG